ncbi:MAG: hypothetical protein IT365_23755 [Candidatus Hydrogenedentes bacterium]|nr:hypothetical protein [Candidatus Hydrogenedentota bacterium]
MSFGRSRIERVYILKENVDYRKPSIEIEVDGNIDTRNAVLLANAGARVFVLGSSSIFKGNARPIGEALTQFRTDVDAKRKTV